LLSVLGGIAAFILFLDTDAGPSLPSPIASRPGAALRPQIRIGRIDGSIWRTRPSRRPALRSQGLFADRAHRCRLAPARWLRTGSYRRLHPI
jgi:hypothetical protein